MILAIPLAEFGLLFGPAEYFMLALFGLTIVASLSANNQIKGLISACIGLLLATVGVDAFSGAERFTFGSWKLSNGIALLPVMVGLFALSEVFFQIYKKELGRAAVDQMEKITRLSFKQIKKIFLPASIFGALGNIVGVMPGAGATIASWLAYSEARRWSKHPENFGKGEIMGVIAPESANNGVPAGALVPLLALGIPGSNSTAILLGAFMIHGVAPGPMLFETAPALPYTIMACMVVSQIVLLILGQFLVKPSVKVTSLSKLYLSCSIIALSFVGAYAEQKFSLDVVYALFFGVLGFFIKLSGFSTSSMVLGFVLGEIFERNFRRAMTMSSGSLAIFVRSPISKILFVLVIIGFALPFISSRMRRKKSSA
jgi:putative tricarboxylic transport membrane protein